MMQVKKNVAAAITAAVHFYLQTEQQAVAPAELPTRPEPPRPAYNPWAMSGRQTAMDLRRLWQMRLVR